MKKINTKKYVYIVVETRVDDFGYYDSYEEVFKSESKAREVYMEKRKSILQDWQTRDRAAMAFMAHWKEVQTDASEAMERRFRPIAHKPLPASPPLMPTNTMVSSILLRAHKRNGQLKKWRRLTSN